MCVHCPSKSASEMYPIFEGKVNFHLNIDKKLLEDKYAIPFAGDIGGYMGAIIRRKYSDIV